MSGFHQDVRYALRGLRKNPSFTAVAVLTLALGIGANSAVFSVLNAVLLQPLPYRAPEQLAMLWTENPAQGLREGRSRYYNVEQWRLESKSFTDMAVFDPSSATLTGAEGSEKISVARVSPNIFALLGVEPAHGRIFSTEEADRRERVVVLSHAFWQTRFGGAFDAIGRTIFLDGLPSTIIGVLPAEFQLDDSQVWEAHTMFPDWEARRGPRGDASWFVMGRLRPHATVEQAQVEMNTIAQRLSEHLPAAERTSVSVVPLSLHVVGARPRLALWMLAGAVFCVLLIAVTNIAGLSLARSTGREREMAIRVALGAGSGKIVRQLLVESVTLSVVSGLLALLVAQLGIRLILAIEPGGLARSNEIRLDWRVLGAAAALSLLTGILVGLAPALITMRRNLKPSFHEGGRAVSGGKATRRTLRGLVIAEFALTIVLLVGAGLLTRSFLRAASVDPGFTTENVLSIQLASPAFQSSALRADYYQRVLEQVGAVGGVEGAGMIGDLFIGGNAERVVTVEDGTRAGSRRLRFRQDEVSAGFFTTLEVPLLAGRFFSFGDGPDAPRVAIVNEAMLHSLWPEQNPIGKRFKLGSADSGGPWFTVVGVVGDMRRRGPEVEPIPQMFEALSQNPGRLATVLVRTSGDPLQRAGTVQAAIRRVDKQVPVYGVTTLEDRLIALNGPRRFQTSLFIVFSLVALVLAAIGIYGLIRYSVATRIQEISIRMAVGAERSDIFRMVIGEGLSLSLTGLAVGLMGALWVSNVLSSLLFGVGAGDPATFGAVSVLLTAVATAACYFPARRATRVDPLAALRYE